MTRVNGPFISPIKDLLEDLHTRLSADGAGEVATYIPELGKADPRWFGLAVATLGGHVYEAGDTLVPFTVQSVSKPFVYALALEDRGLEEVLTHVGVEPTGDAFNAVRLQPETGRPYNPMVNAGAIVTASLLTGNGPEQRLRRVVEGLSAFAGRNLDVDQDVLASEEETGDRNRALAYLMHGAGSLGCPVEEALAVYFGQCSVLVTTRDLAVMAATLAGGGVNPLTGRTVVSVEVAAAALTVMATCGTYDYAGEWLVRAGLPAKSGVTGGLIAALPSQLGLGVFSPRLDPRGNTVRGVAACQEISSRFGLHVMRPTGRFGPVFHRSLRGDSVHSGRVRPERERALLARTGRAIAVYELQGDLGFGAAEAVVRTISEDATDVRWVILDLLRVGRVYTVAATLLDALVAKLCDMGVTVVVVDLWQRSSLPSAAGDHASLDAAIEWCEEALLATERTPGEAVPLAEQDLLSGLSPAMIDSLAAHLERREYGRGDRLSDGAALYFVVSGGLARHVLMDDPPRTIREASMAPGTAVGRLAFLDDDHLIVAEEPTVCLVLTSAAQARLEQDDPGLFGALRWSIARSMAARLRQADAENHALIS